MRRLMFWMFCSFYSFLLWPCVAGCAKGGDAIPRRRDAGVMISPHAISSADAGTRPVMRESCNGEDDDLDSHVDEDFLCPLGRMGEICVTSCGVNGYRLCEAPSCTWSTVCHNFDELCGDDLDNDCDGHIDEDCAANPTDDWMCREPFTSIHLTPDPTRLGICAEGWTLILWGAGGAFEPYISAPGTSLDATIRDDWLGWAAFTAYCGDWDHVHHWESDVGHLSSSSGVSVTLDGDPVPVEVCYDPGGDIIRPLIPVQCGLPACPGPSY